MYRFHHIRGKEQGFTLMEMLVVLVIISLTTGLMATVLSNTWTSFEKLSSRDMRRISSFSSSWMMDSIKGAVLYHPYQPSFIGKEDLLKFITFSSPDDAMQIPQPLTWQIKEENEQWLLGFSRDNEPFIVIQTFNSKPRFDYLIENTWQSDFQPQDSQLPRAVRLMVDGDQWLMAKVVRPLYADIPPELTLYGAYEFD
jgi:prepilin-type N-terminal cleavage/methylation domain-containing protein